MKSYAVFCLVGLAGVMLSGCPIYANEYCNSDSDCPSNAYCSDKNECLPYADYGVGGSPSAGGSHNNTTCSDPNQCGANSVCGVDGFCHTGDCSFSGCVKGYTCALNDADLFVCVPSGGNGGSGGSAGKGGSAGTGGSLPDGGAGTGGQVSEGGAAGAAGSDQDASKPVYCGNPKDCPADQTCAPQGVCQSGTCSALGCVQGYVCSDSEAGAGCVPSNPAACIIDDDCTILGYKCVNGTCTAPDNLCTDKTQCPGGTLGEANCVDGKCVPSCKADAGAACSTGYVCDANLGICTPPASGCTVTQDCNDAGQVCVAGACVPKCQDLDGGLSCPTGQVCVANGCVPDEQPKFDCSIDGTQDVCASTSICLHHHCYISCEGGNSGICANNPPDLNLCKTVTTSSGQHNICGSNANLGSECDPTLGTGCTSDKFCIDGFCK